MVIRRVTTGNLNNGLANWARSFESLAPSNGERSKSAQETLAMVILRVTTCNLDNGIVN
jgi:hypothetical protein